jgi:hypothetical protein
VNGTGRTVDAPAMTTSLIRLTLCLFVATAPAAEPAIYLGFTPPDLPQPFNHDKALTSIAFAPGLRLAVLSARDAGIDGKVANVVYEARRSRDEWSSPVRVRAFGEHPGGEVAFSPDGRWPYFSSDRPPAAPGRPRAFRAPVDRGVIGAPVTIDLVIAAEAGVYYPRPLPNGDLLFTSRGPQGSDDLFIARALGGGFDTPRLLETAPALTPDGRALFFLRRIDGADRLFWVCLASVLEE